MMDTSGQKPGATYHFQNPEQIKPSLLAQVEQLIKDGEGVGIKYLEENIRKAFLIGYALNPEGKVIGTVTLKRSKIIYRKKIEDATGHDLSDYLERGYTSVLPEFRGFDIADTLIKGLIKRSTGKKIYTTIRMDNVPAIRLTEKNGMVLLAKYFHHKTSNEIGLFTNQS